MKAFDIWRRLSILAVLTNGLVALIVLHYELLTVAVASVASLGLVYFISLFFTPEQTKAEARPT